MSSTNAANAQNMQFQQMELMSQLTNVINAANAECAKGTKCYDQQQITDTKNKYDAAVIVANNAPKMVETAHYDYLVASKGETAAKEELKRQHMATGMQERATATKQFEGFYRGVTDILTSDDAKDELADIKMQFYVLMEKYPQTYANFKMTPNLPSARDAHDRMDAELTKLYSRMFLFRGTMEKKQNDNEAAIAKLARESVGLNAEFEERTASLNSKNALMSQMPFTVGSGSDVSVIESFTTTRQLPGCNTSGSGTRGCPCVDPGQTECSSLCDNCPADANQRSLVTESASIAKRAYIHAVFRIIYLLIGICIVSYFIYQLVRSPDSVVLNDARQFTNQTYDAIAARAREIPTPMGMTGRGNANLMRGNANLMRGNANLMRGNANLMRGNANPMGMRGNAMRRY